MVQLFRSRSCGPERISVLELSPPTPSLYLTENEDEEGEEDDDGDYYFANPISTPLIIPAGREGGARDERHHFPILEILLAALKKSLVTCSMEREDICAMDISWPTNVRHVSHVTFDRYNGFLGLPVEFETDVPCRVPSASASVFGVSAESMQCSYDQRGNSVPTILLMMQRRLYLGGGLQAEGIFRINAENSQEEYVRNQLNKGVVPHGVDVHCLAGLIKMADPLTALIHAVQVMNLLKTLIIKTLRDREESAAEARYFSSCSDSPGNKSGPPSPKMNKETETRPCNQTTDVCDSDRSAVFGNLLRISSEDELLESDTGESFWSFRKKSGVGEERNSISGNSTPVKCDPGSVENECNKQCNGGDAERFLDKLNLRKGVKKLYRHPVFQLSKPVKKSGGLGVVNSRGGGEAWA
ncbi:PREDICTED: rho GTPase-activating protein 3 isoform X2 [Nelumbo nucifera]|uniref:Rho GTPase-activating protein 3 isoform X2 n=1 Tax=Nelumbo nucifera TaxID=4432 RepID=A0A1U8AJL5_NELNU|nr:PREDICTED: rho GTPase-activating protein 3 isoform X2 [Nelumbo nucifera]